MIVAFGGVGATGKTTIAEHLVANHEAIRIPEVNVMFGRRPDPEPTYWYLEREIERWKLACQQDQADRLIVLDGDPYQPVWLNWIYAKRRPFQPWHEVIDFFEARLDQVGMPEFYVYLHTPPAERYRRENIREVARGHNEEQFKAKFERYARMLGPQKAYFEAVGQRFPGFVFSQEAVELEATASSILDHRATPVETAQAFSFMRSWLAAHSPDDF